MDYGSVRQEYQMTFAGIITEYLYADRATRSTYADKLKRLVVNYFSYAFEAGWEDGGGDAGDIPAKDLSWLLDKKNAEYGHIDLLMYSLKEVRAEIKKGEEFIPAGEWPDIIDQRTSGYLRTLDGIYSEGKVRGAKSDISLTFVGPDGQENCNTCARWKGKRHRRSFWLKRGLVPGIPGNPNFECRGYNCQHYLITDDGKRYTL